jgi:hypothetical protein
MKRTSLFVGLLLLLTPCLLGQDVQRQPNPQVPEDALAPRQLIAWTRLQQPKPVPEPLPPPDKGVPQPDPQTTPPPHQNQEKTPTQTFTGKIVKDAGKYVLKAGGTIYQLDEQSSAMQYEDKDVRVVGALDTGTNTIRVVKIELIS